MAVDPPGVPHETKVAGRPSSSTKLATYLSGRIFCCGAGGGGGIRVQSVLVGISCTGDVLGGVDLELSKVVATLSLMKFSNSSFVVKLMNGSGFRSVFLEGCASKSNCDPVRLSVEVGFVFWISMSACFVEGFTAFGIEKLVSVSEP